MTWQEMIKSSVPLDHGDQQAKVTCFAKYDIREEMKEQFSSDICSIKRAEEKVRNGLFLKAKNQTCTAMRNPMCLPEDTAIRGILELEYEQDIKDTLEYRQIFFAPRKQTYDECKKPKWCLVSQKN